MLASLKVKVPAPCFVTLTPVPEISFPPVCVPAPLCERVTVPPLPAVMSPICSVVAPVMLTAETAVLELVIEPPSVIAFVLPARLTSPAPPAMVPEVCVIPSPANVTPTPLTFCVPRASAPPAVVMVVRPFPPVTAPVRLKPPVESFKLKVVNALPRNSLFTWFPVAFSVTAPPVDTALSSSTLIEVPTVCVMPVAPESTVRPLLIFAVTLPTVSAPVPAVSVTALEVAFVLVSEPVRLVLPAVATSEIAPVPELMDEFDACVTSPVVVIALTFPPSVLIDDAPLS